MLIESIILAPANLNTGPRNEPQLLPDPPLDDFNGPTSPNLDIFVFDTVSDFDATSSIGFMRPTPDPTAGLSSVAPHTNDLGHQSSTSTVSPPSLRPAPSADFARLTPDFSATNSSSVTPCASYTNNAGRRCSTVATSPPSQGPTPSANNKVESDLYCEICGYQPEGDPRWFSGSMARHRKKQHKEANSIFSCPYPGCRSKFTNREDNLHQHQKRKGHFVDGENSSQRRPSKRNKTE